VPCCCTRLCCAVLCWASLFACAQEEDDKFAIVFAAMGVNMETAHFFKQVQGRGWGLLLVAYWKQLRQLWSRCWWQVAAS
jgi:hypothetical protein